jgi:hypothetical protein
VWGVKNLGAHYKDAKILELAAIAKGRAAMSAFGSKADINRRSPNVRFCPQSGHERTANLIST